MSSTVKINIVKFKLACQEFIYLDAKEHFWVSDLVEYSINSFLPDNKLYSAQNTAISSPRVIISGRQEEYNTRFIVIPTDQYLLYYRKSMRFLRKRLSPEQVSQILRHFSKDYGKFLYFYHLNDPPKCFKEIEYTRQVDVNPNIEDPRNCLKKFFKYGNSQDNKV